MKLLRDKLTKAQVEHLREAGVLCGWNGRIRVDAMQRNIDQHAKWEKENTDSGMVCRECAIIADKLGMKGVA